MIKDRTVVWRPEAQGEHRTNHNTHHRPSSSLLCRGREPAPYRSELYLTTCLASTRDGGRGVPWSAAVMYSVAWAAGAADDDKGYDGLEA